MIWIPTPVYNIFLKLIAMTCVNEDVTQLVMYKGVTIYQKSFSERNITLASGKLYYYI